MGQAAAGYQSRHYCAIIKDMERIQEDIARLRRNPRGIRFAELVRICDRHFGRPRQRGSHLNYPMLWPGDPRVNIQSEHGMAKPYEVRQVVRALEKLQRILEIEER